jgi:hypothetical protein
MKKGWRGQPKGGSLLIKFDSDPLSCIRGLLRLFRKKISKNKSLREDIEAYLNGKFNCGIEFLDELCNLDFLDELELWNLRGEINLPSEVYINSFIFNLCYRYEKYYK